MKPITVIDHVFMYDDTYQIGEVFDQYDLPKGSGGKTIAFLYPPETMAEDCDLEEFALDEYQEIFEDVIKAVEAMGYEVTLDG